MMQLAAMQPARIKGPKPRHPSLPVRAKWLVHLQRALHADCRAESEIRSIRPRRSTLEEHRQATSAQLKDMASAPATIPARSSPDTQRPSGHIRKIPDGA